MPGKNETKTAASAKAVRTSGKKKMQTYMFIYLRLILTNMPVLLIFNNRQLLCTFR